MIRFENLDGIPAGLIDEYLVKYPSILVKDEPRYLNWEANNVKKWTELLRSRGGEELILNAALIHLRRYDDQSFGLVEAWTKRTDPLALSKAIDGAIERMNGWVEEPKKKAREGDGRGE